jgi:hypothetical protein
MSDFFSTASFHREVKPLLSELMNQIVLETARKKKTIMRDQEVENIAATFAGGILRDAKPSIFLTFGFVDYTRVQQ